MQDVRVLNHIDEAEEEAAQGTDARSVAVGKQQQRHHAAERDAAALGHVIETDLMQDDGEAEHQGDVDDEMNAEFDAPHAQHAEDEGQHAQQSQHAGGRCE